MMEIKLPKPIGDFIIDHKSEPMVTNNGYYYHYADICSMLKEYAKQEKIAFAVELLGKIGKSDSLISATMMLEIEIHKLKSLQDEKTI